MKNNLKYYIIKALNEGFALGAINFNNMETLQGIVNACMKENSPAIISVSEGALNYMGDNYVIWDKCFQLPIVRYWHRFSRR